MEKDNKEHQEEIKEALLAKQPEGENKTDTEPEKIDNSVKNLIQKGLLNNMLNPPKPDESKKNHQFWNTQPVPNIQQIKHLISTEGGEGEEIKEGPIDSKYDLEGEKKDPYALPVGFEWTTVDLNKEADLDTVYNFLTENYVEDDDNMFRFDYSKKFLKWALTPPGYFPEWIFGVKVQKSGKLVGFITGIPVHVVVNKEKIKMTEINFLCVHKKLRANRLAPVLIKEVTRRVHLRNQWQAIYTAGAVIPTPITQAKYYHRSLNPKKLVEVKFSSLPHKQTLSMLVKLHKVPDEPQIPGIRPMKPKDIDGIFKLLSTELEKFPLHLKYTQEEIKHWFLPIDNVIYTYVVEKDKGQITDFLSFYCLPSTILKNPKYDQLKAAYLYYNVATSVSMTTLIHDALILANQQGFDVFNCLNIMENQQFLDELKFNVGDGNLHYYLYNWRLAKQFNPSDIGVVLV